MTELVVERRSPPWLIVAVVALALLVLGLGYLYLFRTASQKAPTVEVPTLPVVSACKEPAPGTERIGAIPWNRYMLQFDISLDKATIHEILTDSPPIDARQFSITPTNSISGLKISYGSQNNDVILDRGRAVSARIVKRIIVDDHGRSVGEDDWGYLDPERRWRLARFQGWVQAEYGFVNRKDAELFDQIINSACLLSGPE
jgi:hypothetical protein